jgi:hypothetical protein
MDGNNEKPTHHTPVKQEPITIIAATGQSIMQKTGASAVLIVGDTRRGYCIFRKVPDKMVLKRMMRTAVTAAFETFIKSGVLTPKEIMDLGENLRFDAVNLSRFGRQVERDEEKPNPTDLPESS